MRFMLLISVLLAGCAVSRPGAGELAVPAAGIVVDGDGAEWPFAPQLAALYDARRNGSCDSTRVWLAHDGERLYFLFDVCDDHVVMDRAETESDVGLHDRVELFFSADRRMKRYYGAEMSAGGLLDYSGSYYRRTDHDWNFSTLRYVTRIGSRGYVTEGSVALAELRSLGVLKRSGRIRLGIFRGERFDDSRRMLWYAWIAADVPSPDFHIPASQGVVRLVK